MSIVVIVFVIVNDFRALASSIVTVIVFVIFIIVNDFRALAAFIHTV